ncbi:MAG TPA: [protein-PII] uridylyltransferase, partial [Paracoccaceae bacterium]|nr:[protein-PII] uridylyltransferase [Paracoccaceae bacterium]
MASASSIRLPAASLPPGSEPLDISGPGLVAPPAAILDLAALRARIEAEAVRATSPLELRTNCVGLLREARDAGVAAIAAAFARAPLSGRQAAASYTWLTDQIVLLAIEIAQRWLHPLPTPTKAERMAVLASGGYGRGELAPFSDIDLLFLTPWKQTAWGESVIESALYVLWDLRYKVGHAVRTVDDCLRLARQDYTIRTALLELRFLAGERPLETELVQRLWKELFSRTGAQFVEAKLAERDARHRRHGGSRYLLEPNVKEAKGGLRDLQTLYWIAKYLYHAGTPEELVSMGVFTQDEVAIFNAAEGFLWSVRCHLHLLAGRAVEIVTFDMQVEIAARLGFDDANGRRAVENFMQVYFTHTRAVGELTRIFCAMLEARHVKSRPSIGPRLRRAFGFRGSAMPEGFIQRDGRIDFADPDQIPAKPILLLRMFREATRTGLLIHPNAYRTIAARLPAIESLRGNAEANTIFLDLLFGNSNPERALRRMNETGVLGALLPEFGEIVCLMQFNMYHQYTVDEHTINCLSILSRIERGELREELPIASEILRQGVDRTALYLAVLLHDIGKGHGGHHSEVGAELARACCNRLGIDEGTTGLVTWLVRHHLL